MLNTQDYAESYRTGLNQTMRVLISKGASQDEAEELSQAAWARGWAARDQLREESRLQAWINTIAVNLFCTERKRASRRQQELPELADPKHRPSAVAVDVDKLLSRCSDIDRKLLLSRYVEQARAEELATELGMEPVTVRVRLHRAKAALRMYLESRPAKVTGFPSPRRKEVPEEVELPKAA